MGAFIAVGLMKTVFYILSESTEKGMSMKFLAMMGLVTSREALEMAAEARKKGQQEGIEIAKSYVPGQEIVQFSRICRKYGFRVVTNISDTEQAQENLQRLFSEQLNSDRPKELCRLTCHNVKYITASNEHLLF